MVEPHKGHQVEYNRWYERDHFYAGCMIGAWNFAGRRFVATRDLKALRQPREPNPITPEPAVGSYLALYWILEGHHRDWNRWAVDQVKWLHANGRMFAERDHIHTLLYRYEWSVQRDPEGVSAELALDHNYPGLAVVVGEVGEGVERSAVEQWYRTEQLPAMMGERSPVSLCLSFSPLPLLGDAPSDVPRSEAGDERFMHLYFLDEEPAELWEETFAEHGSLLEKAGIGRLLFSSPFVPTLVGTDTYADQLW
jgi:hypothetical protein